MAWAARSLSGSSTIILNNAVAQDRPLDAKESNTVLVNDARMEFAWGVVKQLINRTSTPQALKDALATAENSYFGGSFKATRADLVANATGGRKPSINADQWRDQIVAASETVGAVASRAIDVVSDVADAASAASLADQIHSLDQLVAAFRIAGGDARPTSEPERLRNLAAAAMSETRPAPRAPARKDAAPASHDAPMPARNVANGGTRDREWEEF